MQPAKAQFIRRVGAAVLVVAGVIVWFAMAPSSGSSSGSDYQSQIAQALADDKTNNTDTAGAAQQTVVNGWTARDLLTIIADEGSQGPAGQDQRPAAMLGLLVLGLALLLVTTRGDNAPQATPLVGAGPSPQDTGPQFGPQQPRPPQSMQPPGPQSPRPPETPPRSTQ